MGLRLLYGDNPKYWAKKKVKAELKVATNTAIIAVCDKKLGELKNAEQPK